MLRIIDGKRYNTETATKVVFLDTPYHGGDFKYEETSLYITKNGAWFLAGKGGPMTRWARKTGQSEWSSGDGIQPILPSEARAFLEEQGETALIEQYFGDEIKDA